MKHDFIVESKRVSWKYIKQFYEFDSNLKIRMAPKLTKKHIELPPFAAMRVCLAAQVLSHTVAAGIYTYNSRTVPPEINTRSTIALDAGTERLLRRLPQLRGEGKITVTEFSLYLEKHLTDFDAVLTVLTKN